MSARYGQASHDTRLNRRLGITEISANPPAIAGAPTSIALFVGWAPCGPTDRALWLSSFADYEREFGGLDARSLLGYAVRHFYDNGGLHAWVLRIAGGDGGAIAPTDAAFAQALSVAFSPDGPVDRIDAFNLICVPGLADAAATAMLQAQAAARRAFLIADCDEAALGTTVSASLTGKTGAHAANSALYFPWVLAADPLQKGAVRAFPASGFVAGVFARTDATRGVWKSPAGTGINLAGATDFTVRLTDVESTSLTAQGINCLRKFVEQAPSCGARARLPEPTVMLRTGSMFRSDAPPCFWSKASPPEPNGRCSSPMTRRYGRGCAHA